MAKDLKSIYISKKGNIDINKIYDDYAKEVLNRKGYPLRAVYKAGLLYEFSLPVIQKISSIADIGGCYGYCLAQFQKLYEQKEQTKIKSAVYEIGKEYLIRGPKIFPQIDFIHSDKLGDEKYGLVLLCDVLEHVIDYDEFLDEIRNISQEYVLVWSPIELTPLRKILIRLKLMPKIKWGEEHPEKHVNFWDVKETMNILNDHFKILKIGYATGKHMTEKDGREIPSSKRSILKKIFYSSMKYVPDYFYIKLIGGHLMILCEVVRNNRND